MSAPRPETIVAPATPAMSSAIGIIRLSGPDSFNILQSFFTCPRPLVPRRPILGDISHRSELLDTAVATLYAAPHSYTGENVVEISCHGNPLIISMGIDLCLAAGARLARPGEFTQRAFLNHKINLSQAEGVADLIYADGYEALRASNRLLRGITGDQFVVIRRELIELIAHLEAELDFDDQEISRLTKDQIIECIDQITRKTNHLIQSYQYGRLAREGIRVVIAGPPNSGKSSLFNAILNENRALVSPLPGTTRDYLEAVISRDGFTLRLFDTAGLGRTTNEIESEGIKRTRSLLELADFILVVNDISQPPRRSFRFRSLPDAKIIPVFNKVDLVQENVVLRRLIHRPGAIACSAKTGLGVDQLLTAVIDKTRTGMPQKPECIISHKRHIAALHAIHDGLLASKLAVESGHPNEIIVIDLREALDHCDHVLGKTTDDDILNAIFDRFCIGK